MTMEETKDGFNVESENDDRGLAEELEFLYRRVAQVDQPDASVEKVADAHGGDEDPLEIRQRDDPRKNPPNREKLLERLMVIQDAYERILTCWPYAALESPSQPSENKGSPE